MTYTFETMTDTHRAAVVDIFNYYVEKSFAAYPETTVGYDFFDRLLQMLNEYPALVAKTENGDVVGFALIHPYHPLSTFKNTAEITYFITPEHTRKGLGKAMLDRLSTAARKMGVDNLLASISSRNLESLTFHCKYGFVLCGTFRDIGKKRGETFDVVWMQKRI